MMKDWSQVKKALIEEAIEPSTKAQYNSTKKNFETFCISQGKPAWPADLTVVEDYTAMLIYEGKPGAALNAWSGIKHVNCAVKGHKEILKSHDLKRLHTKAQKNLAKTGSKYRDPIPLELIRQFCNRNYNSSDEYTQMCCVLIVVGIRALLRGGELAALKWKHIKFQDGMMVIDLGVRKNKKLKAEPLWIDPSQHKETCPVRLMRRWKQRQSSKKLGSKEDHVFRSRHGKAITYDIIKEIIQKVTGKNSFDKNNFKSHSLRITGAVLMMRAGKTPLEIQLMGNWKSDAFLRYLRTFVLAADGLTTQMGF
jgi:integrase